jgi:hypothetical protein
MIRFALCAVFGFFALFCAGSEEKQAGASATPFQSAAEQPPGAEGEADVTPGASDFFPVLSLYETALAGEISWRPDWPLSIPPDAFSFSPQGGSALTLIMENGGQTAELTVRRNGGGLLAEFPLFRDGGFFQVQTRFGGTGLIRGFAIAQGTPEPQAVWDILIAEYEDAFPSLIRITQGETVFFSVIEYKAAETLEIWYDQGGNALAVFSYRHEEPGGRLRRFTRTDLSSGEEFAEICHYDSMGNISGITAGDGEYAALYAGKGRPRYWERFIPLSPEAPQSAFFPDAAQPAVQPGVLPDPPGSPAAMSFEHFSFQWDEEGLLVRFTGGSRTEPGGGDAADIRYEYIRDERGAWTERRGVSMIRRSGFLVSGPVERLLRRIEYPAP